jgi:CO/xanthine dehydrogenase FAD-binding subunit
MGIRPLPKFEYLEPRVLERAVEMLSKHGPKAKILNGGIDLVPRLRRHEITPEYILSIQQIQSLDYLEDKGYEGLRIGALTRLCSLELSPLVQKEYVALYEAVHQIRSIQVKTMGTAVGNLCVATPASDIAATLIALGAKLKISSTRPERIMLLEDFFVGVHQTVLRPGEIVTEVCLPRPPAKTGSAFLKLVRTAVDIAKVNVAVMITLTDEACQEAKIVLGSVAPTVVRAGMAEAILKGRKLEAEVVLTAAEAAAQEIRPITDIRSTVDYRKEATRILVRQTIEKALERAKA